MLETLYTISQFEIWAEEYARAVAETFDPDCIILFGSVARNRHDVDSDIDMLVIGGVLPGDRRERYRQLMHLRSRFAPLQVHAYSRAEWDEMMAAKHVTALEALNDGIPLYGEALFAKWRGRFEGWLALGLQRSDFFWRIPSALQPEPIPTH